MHRYDGSESGKDKQKIENYTYHITQPRHRGKGLLKDIGQSDKYERRTAVCLDANRKCSRKDEESAKYCHKCVDSCYLEGGAREIDMFSEITSVSTEARHAYRQRKERLSECLK